MSASTPPTSLENMEARLAQIELKLAGATPSSSVQQSDDDVTSRINKLMRLIEINRLPPTSTTAPLPKKSTATDIDKANAKRVALHEEYQTIDRLLSDKLALSPIAGPAAAAASSDKNNAPMVFRRMEILASSKSMKRDMDLLAQLRDLTNIGTKTTPGRIDGSGEGESKIVNCPIITSERYNLPSNPEAKERLEQLCFRVARLNQRTAGVSQKVDDMLNSYGTVMMAMSEKMVLAEEQIKG